jgi:hydrogenase maturation protease
MITVIGYGNPLRHDDGIGPEVAHHVQHWVATGVPGFKDVEALVCHQLTPELAEPISRSEFVIFVDAAQNGCPGQVVEATVSSAPEAQPFTHSVTPAALLRGAQILYGSSPHACLLTATGESFEYGIGLTHCAESAVNKLLRIIHERVMQCMSLASSQT